MITIFVKVLLAIIVIILLVALAAYLGWLPAGLMNNSATDQSTGQTGTGTQSGSGSQSGSTGQGTPGGAGASGGQGQPGPAASQQPQNLLNTIRVEVGLPSPIPSIIPSALPSVNAPSLGL